MKKNAALLASVAIFGGHPAFADGLGSGSGFTITKPSVTIGTTPITGGTSGKLLYDNSGTTGEKNLNIAHQWYVSKNGSDSNACTYDSPCLTIGHAQSIASSGDEIEIYKGTYTENLTLVAGVSLGCAEARGVFITGTMTASYSGTTYLHHCDLQASSGSVLVISGANAVNLQLDDVHIDGQSGSSDTISYTNTNAATKLISDNGVVTQAVSTSAKAINIAATAAGSIIFEDVSVSILDNPDHVAIAVGGSVSMTHNGDQVQGQITVANTGVYAGVNSKLITTSVASLVTNSASATPSSLTQVIHYTSAHPLVTGVGAFAQGLNVFAGTGYDFAATLSGGLGAFPVPAAPLQLHAGTLAPAGGLASGLLDGMLEYDGTHFYVDIGTSRKQLDQQANGLTTTVVVPCGTLTFTGGLLTNKGTC